MCVCVCVRVGGGEEGKHACQIPMVLKREGWGHERKATKGKREKGRGKSRERESERERERESENGRGGHSIAGIDRGEKRHRPGSD